MNLNNNKQNYFTRSPIKVDETFNLESTNFPTINGKNGSNANSIVNTNVSYSNITQINKLQNIINKEEIKKPILNELMAEEERKKQKKLEQKIYAEHASKILEVMFTRWDKYKNNFIELYGEDTYDKMYTCPPIEFEDLDSEEDEEKEDDDEYGDY
jgi:hypothetical protein